MIASCPQWPELSTVCGTLSRNREFRLSVEGMFEIANRQPERIRVNRRLQRMAERAARGQPIDPDEPDDFPAFWPPGWLGAGPRDPPSDYPASAKPADAPGSRTVADPDVVLDPDVEVGEGDEERSQRQARAGPPVPRLVERFGPGSTDVLHRVVNAVRRRPVWLLGVVGVLVAIITASSMLSGTPEPEAAPRLPSALSPASVAATPSTSATPRKIIVSVVGKVGRPGLVTLSDGARVADALHAAGGVAPGAKITALNLARRLADGEQIYVGIPVPPGASPVAPVPGSPVPGAAAGTASGAPAGKVDLNTATAEQLDELPGIGEVTAQSILDWRAEHGRFSSVSQLNDVDGIGEVRFGKLKDLVEVR